MLITEDVLDLAVIGGGAAGYFGAISVAERNATLKIIILEKSNKVLAKVKVSGGGRCNVTHHCFNPFKLASHYPRGEKKIKDVFKQFGPEEMVAWLKSRGVSLKTESDNRMFPESDDSQTVIDCFLKLAREKKIRTELGFEVEAVKPEGGRFNITSRSGKKVIAKKILIATGGSPNASAYEWIAKLGHTITRPIPSLFTFNDSTKHFVDLMGVAVPNAEVRIVSSKFHQIGPVLITHWGLSGPAIIKLSAWAAEHLHQANYQFQILVSWLGPVKEDEVRNQLLAFKEQKGKQRINNNALFGLPSRLWLRLCTLAEISDEKIWAEASKKELNKLLELMIRTPFQIKGKTTFKEEFVTCGGTSLTEVDLKSMQSKIVQNVFFAGEILNVDGETGGFNFQWAWSSAHSAANGIISCG